MTLQAISDFSYELADGTYHITGLVNTELRSIVIPDTIDGIPVTAISDRALFQSELTHVQLGENIRSIGEYAFAGNTLSTIQFPNALKYRRTHL